MASDVLDLIIIPMQSLRPESSHKTMLQSRLNVLNEGQQVDIEDIGAKLCQLSLWDYSDRANICKDELVNFRTDLRGQ